MSSHCLGLHSISVTRSAEITFILYTFGKWKRAILQKASFLSTGESCNQSDTSHNRSKIWIIGLLALATCRIH